MNKLIITIGFFVMLLAQWFVPGKMIYQQEDVLATGTPYKFKTQPIDPHDPFRGKFIVLNYEMDQVAVTRDTIKRGSDMFVYIETDSLGFARATHASKTRLDTNQDYVKVKAGYNYNGMQRFNLPFNIHYMNEDKAYDAELAVRDINRNRDSIAPACYGLVYIKEDTAVLDDVFIGDTPIADFVEQEE